MPDGDARIYSVTLNPIVHFNPRGRFDAYVIGGGGYYRRSVDYTQPGVGTATFFDPFFGVFLPGRGADHQVLATFIQNKGGLNIGGGISVRVTRRQQRQILRRNALSPHVHDACAHKLPAGYVWLPLVREAYKRPVRRFATNAPVQASALM